MCKVKISNPRILRIGESCFLKSDWFWIEFGIDCGKIIFGDFRNKEPQFGTDEWVWMHEILENKNEILGLLRELSWEEIEE